MHNFKELNVWQMAIELTVDVYSITQKFSSDEKFGLCSQIRRSATSIDSNIAEGAGRKSPKEFCYFISLAQASAFELETQFIISNKLNYISIDDFKKISMQIEVIQKMLVGLQRSLQKKNNRINTKILSSS